jgi:heme oxygenase
MGNVDTTMAALKAGTRALHERAERAVDIIRPSLDRAAYLDLLARFYGLHHPLERRLAAVAERRPLPVDPRPRRKAYLLEADLVALGMTVQCMRSLPLCTELPDLSDAYRATGCMYVLEGATLGGRILLRTVCARLDIGADAGGSFFASYGDRIGPMWKQFGSAVNGFPGIDARRDVVVASACRTFEAFERWFSR